CRSRSPPPALPTPRARCRTRRDAPPRPRPPRRRRRRTGRAPRAAGSLDLAGIERVAHRLADEDEEREHDGQDEEAGEAEPGRLEVGLALREDLGERERGG